MERGGEENSQKKGPFDRPRANGGKTQSDLLDGLGARMVISLRGVKTFPRLKLPTRLTPILTVQGKPSLA